MPNKIIIILCMYLSITASAQSLYNARSNTKISQTTTEAFNVTFKKSMYGIAFKTNDRLLTNSLKTKIERFMANTNRSKFKGLGTFTLTIIKRQDSYFVVEEKQPEKLLGL